ncbi:MAG: MarR family transcriptional regulator [Pseudomonadota bacterium]
MQKQLGPGDAGFVLDDYVMYNLVRATAVYSEKMSEALKSYGLNTMKWRILMLLDDKSPSSVSDLARRSVTKMPTLTRMLIRMEEEGLVKRTALADDRRVVEVTMTPNAVKTLRIVQKIGHRIFERAFEGVSGANIGATTSVLQRIRENLERSPFEATTSSVKARAS